MLYFGSFNPIHKGHIALAEYAIEKGLCDEVVLVVSPQNPLKPFRPLNPRTAGSGAGSLLDGGNRMRRIEIS